MNYKNILESHYKYGTNEKDIINRMGYTQILKNVKSNIIPKIIVELIKNR